MSDTSHYIAPPSDSEIPPDVLHLLNKYPRINIYTTLARSPEICTSWIGMINGVYASGLDPRLREIALVRIGVVTDSKYELHQHRLIALKNGVTEEEIEHIINQYTVTSLDADGNLICRAIDELRASFTLSDETFAGLSALLDTKDLVSLGATIAIYFAVALLANFCGLQIEESNPLKEFAGFEK